MKKVKLFALALVAFMTSATAQDLPKPSPFADVFQRVGLTDFKIEYSRPGVKDRAIFGELLPFGKIWRTGANAATTISFSTDVNFGGVDVEKGTYSIFTIPGKEGWKMMLNTDLGASEGTYDESKTVANVPAKNMESNFRESMIFLFDNVKDESADLILEWEKTKVVVPVRVAAKEEALKNIEAKMNELENAYGVYNSSAKYFLDSGLDLDKALAWSKKSVAIKPVFWNVYTLSLIYEAKGDKKMAIATAKQSLALAEKANYDVYINLNKENIAKWSK